MTENAPPRAAAKLETNAEAGGGMPYYEKLRCDLRALMEKKRINDQDLARINEDIRVTETAYLEDTSAGNIVKGFDNYIKNSTASTSSAGGAAARRKAVINAQDRIFSQSSASFMASDSPGATSARTTPSHAPTPTSPPFSGVSNHPTPGSTTSKSVSKKRPSANDDEDTEGKLYKRGKITYCRE